MRVGTRVRMELLLLQRGGVGVMVELGGRVRLWEWLWLDNVVWHSMAWHGSGDGEEWMAGTSPETTRARTMREQRYTGATNTPAMHNLEIRGAARRQTHTKLTIHAMQCSSFNTTPTLPPFPLSSLSMHKKHQTTPLPLHHPLPPIQICHHADAKQHDAQDAGVRRRLHEPVIACARARPRR